MKSLFGRSSPALSASAPRGSFTMDLDGNVVFSSLASTFPEPLKQQIGRAVLAAFAAAADRKVRVTEFSIQYAAFRLTARELRGGVLIFLMPCGGGRKRHVT